VAVAVYIDGEIFDEAGARISVFDRGFLYGDSVYEVARTAGGRPVDYERHIERLERSAGSIWLPCPGRDRLAGAVRRTLAAAANPESYVRIILTRGAGDIGLDVTLAENASTIVIAKPLSTPARELYERGAVLRIIELARDAGLEVTESDSMQPAELRGADEVFITSSIRTVMPIARVDDTDIAAPGPITSRLAALYDEFLASEAARGPL
jgi:branched-subunit amino acid aminotransferase/4-amino-4-deoxychorismate lyase